MANGTPLAFMRSKNRWCGLALAWVFSLVVALSLLATFDLDWQATRDAIRAIDPLWLLAAVASHYGSFLFRAARWRILLDSSADNEPRQSLIYLASVILMSFFVNSVMWLRAGDVYRGIVYATDTGRGLSLTTGTVVMDRLADLFTIAVLVFLALLLFALDGRVAPDGVLVATLVLSGLLVAVTFATRVGGRRFADTLPRTFRDILRRLQVGMEVRRKHVPVLALLSAGAWLLVVLRLSFVLQALDLNISG